MESRFESLLKKKIEEARVSSLIELESGLSITDYARYRQRIGYLTGLRDAVAFIEETNSEMSKGA